MGVRKVITRRAVGAVLAAAASTAAATGCATFAAASKDMRDLVAAPEPNPASQIACAWQNRLATLPDPLRNGAPIPGVAGQIFLYDTGSMPVAATGELTVQVSDATPRMPGQAGPPTEVWHFSNDTLKKLRMVDERIGLCYVVFLPWPETWRDVTRVRFQVRYDQPAGQKTLYANEATVTLDFTPGANGTLPGVGTGGSVPNPADVLRQARSAQVAGRRTVPGSVPQAGVQPTSYPPPNYGPPQGTANPGYPPTQSFGPPVQQPGNPPPAYYGPPQGYGPPSQEVQYPPAAYYGPPGYPPTPGPAAAVQPALVPFRPAGTELAVQGPPEIRTTIR
jgi:hypothetical protein